MSFPQYPRPVASSPETPKSKHVYTEKDLDLESGLAPLSLVSSASSTPYGSPTVPHHAPDRQTTRNISSSHLLTRSSTEKLAGLNITVTQTNDAAWPTREELLLEKRATSKQKCRGLSGGIKRIKMGLSRKQIIWFKVLTALVVIALAVGLGIGITRKVGGGVVSGKDGVIPIAGSHS